MVNVEVKTNSLAFLGMSFEVRWWVRVVLGNPNPHIIINIRFLWLVAVVRGIMAYGF